MDPSSRRPWIVQKYGGTSIGKLLETITGTIVPKYLSTCRVAIVCSARSGTTKSLGTTSLLLEAIRCATSSETSTIELDKVIDTIKDEHIIAARNAIPKVSSQDGPRILETLLEDIEGDCKMLRGFLKATWTVGEVTDRTKDRVLSVGEKLSCRVVAASLSANGVEAKVVLLDDVVQQVHEPGMRGQRAAFRQNPISFLMALSSSIEAKILECGEKVPVITGFFGAMPDALIASVGRGYSDLCAALCACSVAAQELQIWKEVDGIFTADPSKVSSARLLATVTSEEAAELTYYGSEVIHPLTIDIIRSAKLPLRLKNVKNPSGAGTIIHPSQTFSRLSSRTSPLSSSPDLTPDTSPSPRDEGIETPIPVFMTANGYHGEGQARRVPTALTTKDSISVINIQSNGLFNPQHFLSKTVEVLGRHDLLIDLISSSTNSLSLAVSSMADTARKAIDDAVVELQELGSATSLRHLSIVSVVGHRMRNMVGVAGEIFSALAGARVNVYLISQGANEINISFVVKAQDALLAMEVVHTNVMKIATQAEQESSFSKGPWLY